ncbi:MAG: glutamate--tRNA ligase, partial [Actinomycetota bacterium]|nr:glutamate--tRNA ligase [Actinomycetota bacterium]
MEIKNKKEIRFRFAPSPTGGLHIGTARTALFNWLAARSMGGKLILRIEDTDLKRSNKAFENSIINDLKWMELDWDEFYRQSERLDIYLREAERLVSEKKAYRCFCSPERLDNLKESLISEGRPTGYDNKCRDLKEEEIGKNLKEKKAYTIRYKVEPGEIIFNDLIRGEIKFISNVISDFVLIKSDGTPSYNFAVVIDDNDMGISHVLRGEDHITNTARQIMLFKSLAYDIPEFAHLSMILGKDGSKLSKRHGATTITQYREEGYLKEAIVNYLSLLSWAPKDGEEFFALSNIFKKFKLKDVSKNPAIFDIDKLNWINGNYIRTKSNLELKELLD